MALFLFGINALQIILAAGAVLLVKVFAEQITGNIRRWRIRRKSREMESNMWAIE